MADWRPSKHSHPHHTLVFIFLETESVDYSDPSISTSQVADTMGTQPRAWHGIRLTNSRTPRGCQGAQGGRPASSTELRSGDKEPLTAMEEKCTPALRGDKGGGRLQAYHDDVPVVDNCELKQGHCKGRGYNSGQCQRPPPTPSNCLHGVLPPNLSPKRHALCLKSPWWGRSG